MGLTEGLIEDDGERGYIDELRRAVEAPGVVVAHMTCRRCGGRNVVGTVYRRAGTVLWLAEGWTDDLAPTVEHHQRTGRHHANRPRQVSAVLLSVPRDDRPEHVADPIGFCRVHGALDLDEEWLPRQRSGRRAAHIPLPPVDAR